MKIAKAIFRQEAFGDSRRRVCSKKPVLSLLKGPSSPVLRLLEAKATYCLLRPEGRHLCFAHGAYWYDVSTET